MVRYGQLMDDPAAPTLAAPAADELAGFYEHLAVAEFDGYCDLYARLARAMAADPEMLTLVAGLIPATKVVPILLFAAVHDLVLRDPSLELAAIYRGAPGDPWPAFRDLVRDRLDEVRAITSTRTVQTNEVGRCAVLVAATTAVQRRLDGPLALVELGPSAGLNLRFDRYGYRYSDGLTLGDPA